MSTNTFRQYSFPVCTVCGYCWGRWLNNLPEKGHGESCGEMYEQAPLLCVCCVCPRAREQELWAERDGLGESLLRDCNTVTNNYLWQSSLSDHIVAKNVWILSQVVLLHIKDSGSMQCYFQCQLKAEGTVMYACRCDMWYVCVCVLSCCCSLMWM